jgi:hypothetical protein
MVNQRSVGNRRSVLGISGTKTTTEVTRSRLPQGVANGSTRRRLRSSAGTRKGRSSGRLCERVISVAAVLDPPGTEGVRENRHALGDHTNFVPLVDPQINACRSPHAFSRVRYAIVGRYDRSARWPRWRNLPRSSASSATRVRTTKLSGAHCRLARRTCGDSSKVVTRQ